jgi:hypothetical protein
MYMYMYMYYVYTYIYYIYMHVVYSHILIYIYILTGANILISKPAQAQDIIRGIEQFNYPDLS